MPKTTRISGTGFLAGATVMVDIMAVSVTVVNSTTITAIAPAHAAGPVDVVVTNPGGSGATQPPGDGPMSSLTRSARDQGRVLGSLR